MKFVDNITNILESYPFLQYAFFGNKIGEYMLFLLLFLLLFLSLRLFRGVILIRIKKFIKNKGNGMGGTFVLMLDVIKPSFYWFLAFYVSVNILTLSDLFLKIITGILFLWISYYAVILTQVLIDYVLEKYLKKEKDSGTQSAILTIGKFVKATLWLLVGLLVLSNFGINVTSLMAGLGIGGVAIAFALQNILSDLFSSFSIYFDKPFVIGDFIVVGEHVGTVEKIGIKTTRLRALQGEEIVISNRELTTVRVQNFKKMKKRRALLNFGVVYETPLEKLKKIDLIVEKIIKDEKLSEFDRVHFVKFNDFSLDFEAVYFVLSGEYKEFMNTQQNILFKIKEEFEKENISMAFPTQTLHIEKMNNEK